MSLRLPLLLLLRGFLAIGRGSIAGVCTGSRAIPPCWIVSGAAPVCGVVKEGWAITKTSENIGVIKGHEPKCRRKALTVLNGAVGGGGA